MHSGTDTIQYGLKLKEDTMADKEEKKIDFVDLVNNSDKFKRLKRECFVSVKLSLTGITNLVVNYEDPCLVDCFLNACFKPEELYKKTYEMDAVELQKGRPGSGYATQYLDTAVYGTIKKKDLSNGASLVAEDDELQDKNSGKRQRNPDGFVSRPEVISGTCKDRLLIIRNIDHCLDFCQVNDGVIDARSLHIFDNFRNPTVRKKCRILLVTNKRLKFPFKVKCIQFDPVDEFEAEHVISSFSMLYKKGGYTVDFNTNHKAQIVRKLKGLTYTEAGDAFGGSLSHGAETDADSKTIDPLKVIRNLRKKINSGFMEDAAGLTALTSRPWADYICPETSNFTYDIKKMVRDFNEINRLKVEKEKLVAAAKDDGGVNRDIEAIRTRMPHVIILYGRGGVGKSAYPVHFAGLLDFDIWDYNINATHSKWIGEGPERMRDTLARISRSSHLVVRIDEYDRAMGSGSSGGNEMHGAFKQVESEFMNWLQNVQEEGLLIKNDIFIVMTTNHKENITGPLLRSGRADLVMDIADFDATSIKQTFLSAHRRMKNRGVMVMGFSDYDQLAEAIAKLDLDKMAEIATSKGFTVRDIDVLIQEMASHQYYFNKNGNGIPWISDSFIKVLENSTGSAKNENTNELVLGDRCLMEGDKEKDPQTTFSFFVGCGSEFNIDEFKKGDFFKDK